MKTIFLNNRIRHISRIIFAVMLAVACNYYFSFTHQGWLVLATLVVMLTSTGSALYQGLLRFFLLVGVVAIGSLLIESTNQLYLRMNDIALGAAIGILINIVVLPDRVDREFRLEVTPVLQSYAIYFAGIVELLLLRQPQHAEAGKSLVEQRLLALPGWVYEIGFDITLQKGYRYFFRKINQVSEILFAMHHVARYPFEEALLAKMNEPLLQCVTGVNEFVSALTMILDLKKLREGVVDFADDITKIEEDFKKSVPLALELLDVEKKYVYFAEFIYDLRELHAALIKLAKALR